MARKRLSLTELKEELNDISSFRRTLNTRNVLEKLLWISIAICGTGFIFHIVENQLVYWSENQVLITKKSLPLSELKKPAVTYCNKGLYKFGLSETLINHVDWKRKTKENVISLRLDLLKTFVENSDSLKNWNKNCNDFCQVRIEHIRCKK